MKNTTQINSKKKGFTTEIENNIFIAYIPQVYFENKSYS